MKIKHILPLPAVLLAVLTAGCARGAATVEATSSASASDATPAPESPADLEERLTDLQYQVTQCSATEPPFRNEYWDNHEPGLYLDVVSGVPLFSSEDKYESGSGWPAFTKPLDEEDVYGVEDRKLFVPRTEVRSTEADSHLGHVFPDGPGPSGLRYCINSASLRFVHLRDLEKEGLGEYLSLFPAELRAEVLGESADSPAPEPAPRIEIAILAGGCFWGMEDILRALPGVKDTEVGYTGGTVDEPTYADLRGGRSGHAEALRIEFDPDVLSYGELLDTFFRMHDPTTLNRQGNDRGSQYRSAIFFVTPAQEKAAREARDRAAAAGRWKKPIVTEITAASTFWPAEEYHQDYLVKNPGGYTCHYLRD